MSRPVRLLQQRGRNHPGWHRDVLSLVAVAVARMYRGRHYLTDVIAGALLACCWLAVTSAVMFGRPGLPSGGRSSSGAS